MAKAKITNVVANGSYESKYGTMYKFNYTFDDGITLSSQHKDASKAFKIGDEVEYEVKGENTYGKYGSVQKPQEEYSSGKSYSKGNLSSFALSYAKDLAVAHISQGLQPTPNQVCEDAEVFLNWLKNND